MRRLLTWTATRVLWLLDVVVPKDGTWVLRTLPQVDDSGLALRDLMSDPQRNKLVWLVDERSITSPGGGVQHIEARSVAGIWRFLRASVVIHSQGVHGSMRPTRRKLMVNIWHGMPIKRLDPDTAVGRWQTDVTLATSDVHSEHLLRRTWGLAQEQVLITGLPRNDRLLRASARRRDPALEVPDATPLVMWLPTYRRSVMGHLREDGIEHGNVFQLPEASIKHVDALARRLGVHIVIKTHPMAPKPRGASTPALSLWTDRDLELRGLSLYQVLGSADVLVTDHSSVWVDWLLLDRPCIFTIGDLAAFAHSRGTYFEPLEAYLPGPVAADLAEVEVAIDRAILGDDGFSVARREALALHHTHRDDGSALRLLAEIERRLGGPPS